MSFNLVSEAHLKPFKCLRCKVGTNLDDMLGGFKTNWGWFWTNVGLDLGKCQDIARVRFLIMFFFVKILYAKFCKG